jgi:hypothetical protein
LKTEKRYPSTQLSGRRSLLIAVAAVLFLTTGCARTETRRIEVTAYCGCGECNDYYRGRWLYLKLNFWNRYLNYGPNKGKPYTGKTAAGENLKTPRPGSFSVNTLTHPWMLPVRLALPWHWLPRKGTLAADTDYYPFGTEIHVPGWGWGVVTDRGGAIKGPDRLDAYFRWHWQTNRWGRQRLDCTIRRKK